jgi:hypothetical protein
MQGLLNCTQFRSVFLQFLGDEHRAPPNAKPRTNSRVQVTDIGCEGRDEALVVVHYICRE